MDIKLQNLKHVVSRSRATDCFTVTVTVNGERCFTADNDGSGGCSHFYPVKGKTQADVRAVDKWVREQPNYHDLDDYISDMVTRKLSEKYAKKALAKHIMLFSPHPDHLKVLQYPQSFKPQDLNDKAREALQKLYPECLILNDLEIEHAAEYYRNVGYPDDLLAIYKSQVNKKAANY